MNSMLLHVGDTMDTDYAKVPKELDDQFEPPPNKAKVGLEFEKVDNRGRWIIFYYHPVFESGSKEVQYKAHCLSAVYHPVPPNEEDTEICTHGGQNCSTKGGIMGKTIMR